MPTITNSESFRQSLSILTIAQQRLVGARFIANVLDLTDDARIRNAQATASKKNVDAKDLQSAYHAAHSSCVENHPDRIWRSWTGASRRRISSPRPAWSAWLPPTPT